MSSIIDALKKSAQNRTPQSGSAADSIQFSETPKAQNRRGFWWLVLLLLLVAGGLFAWQQGWHHGVVAQAKSWLGAEPSSPTQEAVQPDRLSANNPNKPNKPNKANSTSDQAEQPAASKLTPPKAAEVKAQSVAQEDRKASQMMQQEPTSKVSSENTETKAEVIAQEQQPVQENNADTITVVESRSNQLNAEIPASQSKPIEDDRDMLQPQLKQDYLLIHQIDFAIRKNIPPIKVNIHIFDPDPAKRMVMMNGVKFLAGDVIEDLVTVDEIVKEGVVLRFENIRFLVPK